MRQGDRRMDWRHARRHNELSLGKRVVLRSIELCSMEQLVTTLHGDRVIGMT